MSPFIIPIRQGRRYHLRKELSIPPLSLEHPTGLPFFRPVVCLFIIRPTKLNQQPAVEKLFLHFGRHCHPIGRTRWHKDDNDDSDGITQPPNQPTDLGLPLPPTLWKTTRVWPFPALTGCCCGINSLLFFVLSTLILKRANQLWG